jgi:hypothetical protein
MTWGLLAPAKIESTRRARTLGVGAAVRAFNDLAVPGMGGIWFGKQLVLATLGVKLAEDPRRGKPISNIVMANAVEALACRPALNPKDGARDARLRGSTKLAGRTDFSFATVRKPGFYVTQPMRMATVQALPALGLVEADSVRFNTFSRSVIGDELIDVAVGDRVVNDLRKWISNVGSVEGKGLRQALSPIEPLRTEACHFILAQLKQGGDGEALVSKTRRRAALAWVESMRIGAVPPKDWETKPICLEDDHWRDLRVGAQFFSTRDAAIAVLNCVESHMGNKSIHTLSLDEPIPQQISAQIIELRTQAAAYLKLGHPQSEAKTFCEECVHEDDALVLTKLVGRDERVLRMRSGVVEPGQAFSKSNEAYQADQKAGQEIANADASKSIALPTGISGRITNLFLLNADLHGQIAEWLGNKTDSTRDET